VFAGPTWTSLRAGLLSDVQYTQSYPYDTVTVTGAPVAEKSASKVGFNVGAGVDYRAGARVGLGAQVRWSRATVTLVPATGASVELDAGGLRVGVGGRLFF
jgi:opacity protein-like surface antigen